MAAVFCRVRSPAAIAAMLALEGKDITVAIPEDACEIEEDVAKAVCLNSIDGLEAGSVQWVVNGVKAMGPRIKRKLPRVQLASLLGRRAAEAPDLQEAVEACDLEEAALPRALCMGEYDPLSSSSVQWVMNGIRAARPRVPKVPKVNLGSLWGAKAADLQDDACDLSDGKLSRALCIDHHDPFSSSSTNWVLNGLGSNEQADWVGTTSSKNSKPESAGGWSWNMWRTPMTSVASGSHDL
jgi:hypothetical protein